ncbi:hypothetical protein QJS10_CPB12g00901 [Acorus calamus]|uniref:Reverse transcriptase n=1 Tax=Acorus calamus TaxID=4465 RepID=A0AAV9DNG7_ACOCL|nr:hypothetical protein QJS10_CPB12g00901 [Acorus calamus]
MPRGTKPRAWTNCRPTVKGDVMRVFIELAAGSPGLGRLNSSLFTLIPKKEGASAVDDYRPIYLVNVCYMIVAKVLATRMKSICAGLIPNQPSFRAATSRTAM